GIHSGDSACVLPPHSLPAAMIEEIDRATKMMAAELGVIGLMNVQFGVQGDNLFVLEVNPRASRTVPFVSKATGVPLAKLATKVMMGSSLADLGLTSEVEIPHWAVKEAVFPFNRFEGVDTLLGPEMKSTGEVMGIDDNLGHAIAKAHLAVDFTLPTAGNVFISVRDGDKAAIIGVARALEELGFTVFATAGTAHALREEGITCTPINKISEGRPHILDKILDKEIAWIVNTSHGKRTTEDSYTIRRAAIDLHIPYTTTANGAQAMVIGMRAIKERELRVTPVQKFAQ
ncbi:MAG TPA: carbamoyl phosphate synthase large subunit, partial [Desulfofustis sp.]|nr:carbamoyl phosphate synthase large subunit [Desulfofustis sp.]